MYMISILVLLVFASWALFGRNCNTSEKEEIQEGWQGVGNFHSTLSWSVDVTSCFDNPYPAFVGLFVKLKHCRNHDCLANLAERQSLTIFDQQLLLVLQSFKR